MVVFKMAKSQILTLLFFLNIFMFWDVNGVNIQFYRHQNFNGLVWQSNSSEGCQNIPRNENSNIYSIKTDTCFIAYNRPNCVYRLSMKYLSGDINLASNQVGRDGYIQSFHICNESEGGSQLIVDITRYYGYGAVTRPVPLESYQNVCTCVNIPEYVQKMNQWYIHNHHNTMLAYFEPNCSESKWSAKFVAAEHWTDSNNMHEHSKYDSGTRTTYKIQSFGPDPNSSYFNTTCKYSQVTSTIDKWELVGTDNLEDYANAAEIVGMENLRNLFSSFIFCYVITNYFH